MSATEDLRVAACEVRELADHERRAAGLDERPVEAAVLVGEDPHPGNLPGQPLRRRGVILRRDAEQNAETGADRATRSRASARDALDDGSHSRSRMRELYCSEFGFIEWASL